MSEVKRYDCTNGGFAFCQGCYQMEEDPLGDYVSSEDYDALAAKLTMAEDAAAKGDAARQQCGGMEMEIEELRAELAELRARVVVLPSVDNVMNIVMRYQWNEKTNVTGTTNWAANLGMKVVEEVKRLNGKTVSASALDTLRRFATGEVGHLNNGHCPDDLEGRETRDPDCLVCKALIDTEKSK
ncbi:hypothetical protein [Pseudomonas aeruginosa]|uniref:hypothetical protein n=1 Tax=Pseudomonas aeruginosa TaxID=287 RepID=UPI000AE96072|nr:hypothetical protein [Pseudomonas aeruginosa]